MKGLGVLVARIVDCTNTDSIKILQKVFVGHEEEPIISYITT
jgi:nucleoside permease NupC